MLQFLILGLFAVFFSGEVSADTAKDAPSAKKTDSGAIEICRGLGGLKNQCLGLIKGHSFESEAVRLCKQQETESGKVLCLYHVRNESFEDKELLEACSDDNDWKVIDCLKGIVDKPKPAWAIYSVELATVLEFYAKSTELAQLRVEEALPTLAHLCAGYRYIVPVDPNWKTADCGYGLFESRPSCRVKLRCLSE